MTVATVDPKWLKNKVAFLKGLKKKADNQALLIVLAENPTRTPVEDRKLNALVALEKAADRHAEALARAKRVIEGSDNQFVRKKKKERDHRLILQGILFDLVGLDGRSRGEMLGGLIALVKTVETNPDRWVAWGRDGDAKLAELEKKPARAP